MEMAPWQRYIDAAKRKVAIADFHADRLEHVLDKTESDKGLLPPIPVQAHFEGVIVSVMAAVDQVAQAVNSGLGLCLDQGELVSQSFSKLGAVMPELKSWFEDPLGLDLRRIRVRIIHYSYSKTRRGIAWQVESAGTEYSESRWLLDYAKAAVKYGRQLETLLSRISKHIASSNSQCPAT